MHYEKVLMQCDTNACYQVSVDLSVAASMKKLQMNWLDAESAESDAVGNPSL